MLFEKEHLTFEAQADLLLEKGLIAERDILTERLKSVNYIRFKSYLHPFLEDTESDRFRPNTTLEEVWKMRTIDEAEMLSNDEEVHPGPQPTDAAKDHSLNNLLQRQKAGLL